MRSDQSSTHEHHTASKSETRQRARPFLKKILYPVALDGAIVVVIVLVALWVYSPSSEIYFNPYDLGIASYGGLRVLDGFVPYAEMHTPYGPAQFYILALFFLLFGTSIDTMELESLIVKVVLVAMVYWTLRGCVSRVFALLLTLVVGTLIPIFFQPPLALVGMVFAVGCMTRYSHRQHAGWLVGAGISIGIAGATRWDFGFYCTVVSAVALVSLPLVRRLAAALPDQEVPAVSLRGLVRHLLVLAVSATLVALPFYAPALLTDPWAIFRSIRITLGTHDYRTLPWPDLPNLVGVARGELTVSQYLDLASTSFPAYAFFFLGPLNVIAVLISLWGRPSARPSAPLLVYTYVTTLLGACLLIYADSRPDFGHTLPSAMFMLLSLPLILWLGTRLPGVVPLRTLVPHWGILIVTLLILVPTLLFGIRTLGNRDASLPQKNLYTSPTLAGLSKAPTDERRSAKKSARNYDALVDYIRENTTSDEFIYSGNVRHDKLFVNDVLIYFASERHAGVRDYHMDPGSTTRQDIQQQIIRDLKSNDVRLVVLADLGLPQEPNKSSESSGVTDLDDYIHTNYTVRERFGQYFVLTAREPTDTCGGEPVGDEYGSVVEVVDTATGGSEVKRDGQVLIQGWAATPAGSPPTGRIEVKVEGQQVVAPVIQCIPREEIAENYGQSARHSGWQVTADLRDLEVEDPIVNVDVEAVDRDGGRHSLQKDPGLELRLAP